MVTWLVVVGCIGSFYWLYLVDWFVNWLYGLLVSVVEKTQTAEIQNPNQFYQAQSIRLKHFKLQKLWAKLGKIEENLAKVNTQIYPNISTFVTLVLHMFFLK